ncbi:protein FAM83H [Antennarius striatus]|uniref:protein FAM83H n=1 Tax=Antennarius striatus TaxID=241820 RepID=UPI0035B3434E
MARRSQCSSAGDNPLDTNYLPPHYREEYRLAIDALVEEDLEGYYQFLQRADVVDFLSSPEIQYIQEFVQAPQQINNPEHLIETSGDGSSDTYWPIHSDLDAPGLDLGWPQVYHFIGPTEVTTLVNPPEPEMPSIKEQARRLIKNAQQVIAIVMDMFTDVDIFHDVISAALRNVAVYILLDELNAPHFINMVANCRVNLQSIQFLRVRTVSGITYHCRSGKSFKGQMMDHFLLTDCRAVLTGNYSFMWSFEKLHRCMAHLFLGQLVSTFDEEFRILYAQSQPLIVEDVLPPVEDLSIFQKRQYPSERTSLFREPRKFLPLDTSHPEEWPRHSHEDRLDVDWRMMPLKRKEPIYGPADMYGRFPPQQSRIDSSLDQGLSRIPMLDSPYFKRHSYAEGAHSRVPYQFLSQHAIPEPENQGGQFYRQQQPGKEGDYSSYDKFWNQDYLLGDQYPEPGVPPEIELPDNFDPVANYLSSTGNMDFDQDSDNFPRAADLPFSSSYPRRLSLGQPYTCQTSPTPSNPTEQKKYFKEPNIDRKDPLVKRGLRDWRISSYLSTYDSKGDEGLPLGPQNVSDPFEEPSSLIHPTPGIDLSAPKIPNVREFKVPAVARASQIPSYIKIIQQEQPKNLPDEPVAVTAGTKTIPTPSDLPATTELEKVEEAEQMELKPSVFHREDSFRRKYNVGVQRSSRLRSSLIFNSLEQQRTPQDTKTTPGQHDDESEKNDNEQKKQPFISQALMQRRSAAREPFEWSRYVKSSTFDNSATDLSKSDDGNSNAEDKDSSKDEDSKDLSGKCEVQELKKQPVEEQPNLSPSVSQSKPSKAEVTKTVQPTEKPKPQLFTPMHIDMNDADMRLMFFKELAAKRKAEKAAQAEKSKEKGQTKPSTEIMEKSRPEEPAKSMGDTSREGLTEKNSTAEKGEKTSSVQACKSVSLTSEATDVSQNSQVEIDPNTSKRCKEAQIRVLPDSETIKLKKSQSAANLSVSVEPEAPQGNSQKETKQSSPAVQNSITSHPASAMNITTANASYLAQSTNEDGNPSIDSTSKQFSEPLPSSVEVQPSSNAASDPNTQSPQSDNLVCSISCSQHPESQSSLSNPSRQSAVPDSGSKINPKPTSPSTLHPKAETESSEGIPEDSNLSLTAILSPKSQETISPSSQFVQETPEISATSISQTECETPQAVGPVHDKSVVSEPIIASSQVTIKIDSEEPCALTQSKNVSESEINPVPQVTQVRSKVLDSSECVKANREPLSPNQSSPESCLSDEVDLGSKSRSDQNENSTPTSVAADHPPEPSLAETNCLVHPHLITHASQTETITSPQELHRPITVPSEPKLTGPVSSSSVETVSCSSLTESVGSVLPSSETLSAVGPLCEEANISQDMFAAVKSENVSVPQATGEEPKVLDSSQDQADSSAPDLNDASSESCVPDETDLESKSDQNENITPTSSAADHPSEPSLVETNSLAHPDIPTHASQSGTITSLESQGQMPPSEHKMAGPVTLCSVEIVSSSPNTESVLSVSSHEQPLHSPPDTDTLPVQVTTDSFKTPLILPVETCSPTEPPSEVHIEPDSVPSETQPSEPPVPAPNENMNTKNEESQEAEMHDAREKTDDNEPTDKVNTTTGLQSTFSEKAADQVRQNNCSDLHELTSDEVIPTSPQTKQPKSSQSRYHSSTANVLSSSNLRDDTKLLLEQISANSQSRNDAVKEFPVTDDEKEDKADKNAKREKEMGMMYLSRGQSKTNQERDKILERIQSMRKERKVYSRFEMAP